MTMRTGLYDTSPGALFDPNRRWERVLAQDLREGDIVQYEIRGAKQMRVVEERVTKDSEERPGTGTVIVHTEVGRTGHGWSRFGATTIMLRETRG